jgi:hypothetical protein
MKPTENCFKRGGEEGELKKSKRELIDLIKVHYIHIWKYHNETPLYN